MKRKRFLIIIFSFLAVVSLAALLWPREREPEYNGIVLSEWITHYHIDAYVPQATEAIQHIGTNALPYLLRWIQYEKPRWKKSMNALGAKLPSSVQNIPLLHWLVYDDAEVRAEFSVEAFSVLGSKAKPATDELLRLTLADNQKAPNVQRRARHSLLKISQSAQPGDFDGL